jgi:hypothetical protein
MHFEGLSWGWSATALVACWLAMMLGVSLAASEWDVCECLGVWQFVLFRGPYGWLLGKFSGRRESDPESQAQQLSRVLQIPIVDAELTLELSQAFFNQTDDAELNGEAVELFLAPAPRNDAWRKRADACCQKLRALKHELPILVHSTAGQMSEPTRA